MNQRLAQGWLDQSMACTGVTWWINYVHRGDLMNQPRAQGWLDESTTCTGVTWWINHVHMGDLMNQPSSSLRALPWWGPKIWTILSYAIKKLPPLRGKKYNAFLWHKIPSIHDDYNLVQWWLRFIQKAATISIQKAAHSLKVGRHVRSFRVKKGFSFWKWQRK